MRILRPERRRWMKWEDMLRRFATAQGHHSWIEMAQDRCSWQRLAESFAEFFTKD